MKIADLLGLFMRDNEKWKSATWCEFEIDLTTEESGQTYGFGFSYFWFTGGNV